MDSQPPVLTYATPVELVENSYVLEDRPEGLWVRLPPPSRWHLARRPIVEMALASLLLVPLVAAAGITVRNGSSDAGPVFTGLAIVAVFWTFAVHRLVVTLRRACEPSVLWLTKAKLLVHSPHSRRLRHFECGRYEVADLSLCPVVSPAGACYCRLRVELRNGEVAEIDLRTARPAVLSGLETTLRTRLGLSTEAAPPALNLLVGDRTVEHNRSS